MRYLNDEELEKLVNETEQRGMLKAPGYFEPDIMQRISADNRRTLVLYSIRIMAAAAAAIILIFFAPPEKVKVPDRGSIAIENINRNTDELCDHINSLTERMIIKEDR